MAIRTKRRARFRRATSGTQNLTLLIYNILKEQQAAQKSALLSAFDANMASASYDSTYGGQPVDRASVEAWYAQAIAAYPEGTTERDRLSAELAEFRTRAIAKEMDVYGRAYQDGTYAFGEKVDFQSYMSFLRDARNGTDDPELKQKYLTEEFIVNFNDINDDMLAKGASSSSLLSFYRRQLNIAKEQGIGNENVRKIERYITQAAKQAAADGKREAQEKAGKILSKRTGEVANAIASAIDASANAGNISGQAAYELKALTPMQLVNAFLKMEPSMKASILRSGTLAGVELNGENISGQGIFDYVNDTRDELKIYSNADWVDIETRTYLRGILSEFDRTILAGTDLLTKTEMAADAGDAARFNSAKGLGNPVVNVESYKNLAQSLSDPSLGDAVGAGSVALLNGLVPNPDQFDGKKYLSELTPIEAEQLAGTFSGELFISGNRQAVVMGIISDYSGVNKIQTGGSYLELTIDPNSGQPIVQVTDQKKPGRMVYLYSTELEGGGRVTSAVQQVPSNIIDGNGMTVGQVVLEIDKNRNINRSVITEDGYKIDYDDYEIFLDSQGINPQQDADGSFVFANTSGLYGGEAMKADPRFSKYVPASKWNGVLLGANSKEAEEDMINDISSLAYTTPGGPPAISFEIDEQGNEVARVNDPILVAARLGLTESDLNQIMKARPDDGQQSFGSKVTAEAGVKFFRSMEGNENRASMKEPIDQAEIDRLKIRGRLAVAQYEQNKAKAEQDRYIDPIRNVAGLIGGSPARLAIDAAQSAYNFVTQTPEEEKAFKSAVSLGAFSGPKYAQSATTGSTASDPSEYFFRYTQMSPTATPTTGTGLSTYMSTLAEPRKVTTTTPRQTFTPSEIQQSFNQYRADERKPLNISTSTSTVRK
jgi:hypothetical protein